MANATVEKLKALGIRHGEKIAVGVAGALCVGFLGVALTAQSPVDTTPDQIKTEASSVQSRINQPVPVEVVVEKLVEEGVKNVDLASQVKNQDNNKMRPEQFALGQGWTSQEPGAGLIREKPELLAVRNLEARVNRGGIVVYELDAQGNRIPEDLTKSGEPKTKGRRGRSSSSGMQTSGGYGSGMGGMPGTTTKGSAREEAERKRREDMESKNLQRSLAGGPAAKKEEEKKPELDPLGPPEKETVKGQRTVVLTAVLDHKAFRESYAKALKLDISQAHPKYLRVDVERQQLQANGAWTPWTLVDRTKNEFVLNNIPEKEPDLATPESILEPLVDNVPFYRAGYWQGIHRREFVPEEKQSIQRAPAGGAGMMSGGYGPGMGRSMGGESGMGSGEPGMMSGGYGPGMGRGGMMGMEGMEGSSGGYGGYGAGMGMSSGGGDVIDYPTSQTSELMVRTIDFTVEPNSIYRYRVRLVVQNPNWKKEMIAPDVDTKVKELVGPPSEQSQEITVPGDLTAYVVRKMPAQQGGPDPRGDKIEFRIAKWLSEDGQVVVKPISYSAGQILGERNESVSIPTDGEGVKLEKKDLTSHQLVVDTDGGTKAVVSLGIGGGDLEIPAQALILRPDGSIMLRNQARDAADQEARDVFNANKIALADSKKKREPGMYSSGGYDPGGEGGGGMMAPGMGGGRR